MSLRAVEENTGWVEIPLTRGKVALVDAEDYERIAEFTWHACENSSGLVWYASAHVRVLRPRRKVQMHRLIMNASEGQQIDHKNLNGLDNRKCNLRFATSSQNQANRPGTGIVGFKGVYPTKDGKFTSSLAAHGNYFYLGTFTSAVEAARAYNVRAKEVHGEFAWLNPV